MRLAPLLLLACGPPSFAPVCPVRDWFAGDLVLEGLEVERTLEAVCAEHQGVDGDLVVRDTPLSELSLACLCEVSGDLVLDGNPALRTAGWPQALSADAALPQIGGDLLVLGNTALTALSGRIEVGGDAILDGSPAMATLDLRTVGGDLRAVGSPGAIEVTTVGGDVVLGGAAVELPNLVKSGGLTLTGQGGTISAPDLLRLAGDLSLAEATGVHLDAPALLEVDGAISLWNTVDPTWSFPADAAWSVTALSVDNVSSGETLALPVAAITGDLTVVHNAALAAAELPITAVGGSVLFEDNPALASFTTPGTTVGGDLRLRTSALGGTLQVGPFMGAVGGDLEITDLDVENASICFVTNVGGDLAVRDASFCAEYAPALAQVDGDAAFTNATQGYLGGLHTIGGSLRLENVLDGALTYPVLTSIGGDLIVLESPTVTWISLPSLVSVQAVSAIGNQQLVGIPDMPLVADVVGVEASNNPQLVTLIGLSGLQSAGELHIEGADPLVTLFGLEQLATVEVLTLESNATLLELDALASLVAVQTLTIRNNPVLPEDEIDEFIERVPTIGHALIENNGP